MLDQEIWERLQRGAQVILPKDSALIAGLSGVSPGDKVAEAGSGSGWFTVFIANALGEHGKVYSYDVREEFQKIAKRNTERAGMDKRVQFVLCDVTQDVQAKDLALFLLDMPDAQKALKNVHAALKKGGFAVGYLPNVEQARDFVEEGENVGFELFKTVDGRVEDWLVRKNGSRPATQGVLHTAFLVFLRKK
ncbi:MAG TPA: methyltransferase domain-containing protein [Candidatus Norongarragalinales archaeon]|jgi:tRNA (adenine57-N1/adenine58-N1)-methyltransferase|nr:methyltransferase domain-containing protein [Candidatus Norongarragalinales archaeon]